MKPIQLLTKSRIDYLFHHILLGFESSNAHIEQAFLTGLIDKKEQQDLHAKNATRLIARIKDFKLVNRIISLFFAALFTLMQVNGDDIEMRRPTGRRRNETELAHG